MIQKVLIANRGEIALRVIAACRELGISTVAVYSTVDQDSLHVAYADEAICIGAAASAESYLSIPAIISAAEIADVDAIHPGYGFLAENAAFAEICSSCGIRFIGPSPKAIQMMGNKAQARQAAKQSGIPVLPGSDGPVSTVHEAMQWAEKIGYPVILKAAMGGGGRGMRIVHEPEELEGAFLQACQEATHAFNNGDVYLEKYINNPRHIEFQVLGDDHGDVISLGERECSLQRRHQKLLEEAPANRFDQRKRRQMGTILSRALGKIGYSNAGTVEFLMDSRGELYFIELNARIQVEHPVTEAVTGVDLVKSQLLLASGERLKSVVEQPVYVTGHAIECRINAEDPRTFMPSAGRIEKFVAPGGLGVRVDSAAYSGSYMHPHYDSLVAKVIVHADTRKEAIVRMQRALGMCAVEGIRTSLPLQQEILKSPDFLEGHYDTHFFENFEW